MRSDKKKRAALYVGRSLFTTLNNLCSENSPRGSDGSSMRAEFCNRFLNIWSGFGAFSHVGNLAEIFDGMNIRVIEKSNTLRDAG